MAQSKRRTVKVVLLATMLAGAGAGVYYLTTGGGGLYARFFGHCELVAEEPQAPVASSLSRSDMDAVAHAWANATPAKPAAIADKHVAPTAYAPATDTSDDRYAMDYSATADSDPPTNDHAGEVTQPAAPVELPVTPPRDVTRGQEPNDLGDGTPSQQSSPQEIDPATASGESSRRAREAFGDDMAATPAAQYASADRYNAPTRPGGDAISAPSAGAATNPFASQSSPEPIAAPVAEPSEYHPQDIRTASAAYRTAPPSGTDRLRGTQDEILPIQSDSFGTTGDGTGRPGEQALEGPQRPALEIQKFAPPEIQVGKAAKFAIQVRNAGGQSAEHVVIRDEVPHGTRVVSTTPHAESDGNFLVWDLGALSTGEQRTVEIELMPIAEGEIGSVASVTYAAQASAKTRCTMPQLAIRMTAPSQVMIGQEQRVKIELRNPGTGDATGVMLMENVPDIVKHAAGPALEFEVGTLKAGETREMELVLTAEKAGPVTNTLTARAEGNLQVQQQVEFEVIAPDLQLSVEGPQKRYLERPATYQVVVENPGTAPARDIELVTKLPKGMQFVKANNMGEYDAATHSVYWSLAQLPEGQKGTVELTAMPVEAGQQKLEISGKAQQGLSDEVEQDVLVEGLAALMFEVRDTQDPIEVGGETTYEIRVVNQGSKAATNVQVVVSLPPGIQALSASGETQHTVQAGGVVFEPLAQLAPKTDTLYRVQVKGVQPGDQRVTVQVNTDDISQPIRREESTRVFGDE
jgi:uncharacterized repeat protein (TIGR01451 family)